MGEGHEGAIYHATGPDRLTGAERAALEAEASGRPFAFVALPGPMLRGGPEQAGLPPAAVGAVLDRATTPAEV